MLYLGIQEAARRHICRSACSSNDRRAYAEAPLVQNAFRQNSAARRTFDERGAKRLLTL